MLDEIIKQEEQRLNISQSSKESVDILYNLIFLKNRLGRSNENYTDIKQFLNYYVDYIKIANYGYDNFNYNKIETLLNLISPAEQITLLQYSISTIAREFPENDREWFIKRKHQAEIKNIISLGLWQYFFKAFFLYVGLSLKRLFCTLLIFIVLISLMLLPSPKDCFICFSISYEHYSDYFLINHFLNVLSLFVDLENDFKITPLNWWALILLIIGKISFILLFVNFIYIKISDKISLK